MTTVERWNDRTNLSLLTDFYELTMSKGYLDGGFADTGAIFDMFFRSVPDGGGFAIMAGVEQLSDYLESLSFSDDDLAYLRDREIFDEGFLAYLRDFDFSCDVWAVPEGAPVFPGEPLVKVRGPVIQAQMIETMLLLSINHQSLIATKANRIVRAAEGRPVMEFGSRRAQGADGAVLGARAAYIGGVAGTSCTLGGRQFSIPLSGTMAHSWVQLFDDEFEAFRAYAESFPDATVLLLDTYNVLKSGVPNAIRTAREVLMPRGFRLKGVRIDSGDLAYLSRKTRAALDEAGLTDCRIIASNALDEAIIRDLVVQGAAIDAFGVGERLITSRSEPVFGGVYKMAAVIRKDVVSPRFKISENPGKITNPGGKSLWRLYDRESGKALADVIALAEERIDPAAPYELFDPIHTWKRKTVRDFVARPLLEPLFRNGRRVAPRKDLRTLRDDCAREVGTLWDTILRMENPSTYYVDLSQSLWDLKDRMLRQYGHRL